MLNMLTNQQYGDLSVFILFPSSRLPRGNFFGRTEGNFCGRRRRGRGPADGAPATAAAAAKIEKQITSGWPPVQKKLAPKGRPPGPPAGRLPGPPAGRTPKGTDEKKKIKVCLKR